MLFALAEKCVVGFTERIGSRIEADGKRSSLAYYPVVLPSHTSARMPLLERAIRLDQREGAHSIYIQTSSMWPESFRWLESVGFNECPDRPLGSIALMRYRLSKGPSDNSSPSNWVKHALYEEDYGRIADLARIPYQLPASACVRKFVQSGIQDNFVAHLAAKRGDTYTATCMIQRRRSYPSIAYARYIYSKDHASLRQLLTVSIRECIVRRARTFCVYLTREHRYFEPTYNDLGFKKVVELAMYRRHIGN